MKRSKFIVWINDDDNHSFIFLLSNTTFMQQQQKDSIRTNNKRRQIVDLNYSHAIRIQYSSYWPGKKIEYTEEKRTNKSIDSKVTMF